MLADHLNTIIDKIVLLEPLSLEEKELYKKATKNVEFVEELEYRKNAAVALKAVGRDQLKNHLISLSKTKLKTFQIKRLMAIAASLLVLIIAGISLFQPGSESRLYNKYFESYENTIDPMTKGESYNASGYRDYELGKYKEAKEKLTKQNNESAYFYLSQIAMIAQDFDMALNYISKAKSYDNPKYISRLEWYEALSYLGKKDLKLARSSLTKIKNQPAHFYQELAKELLSKLPKS